MAAPALSFSSRLAVGVYLHDFHNLELLAQGWYAVRCRCVLVEEPAVGSRRRTSARAVEVVRVATGPGAASSMKPAAEDLDWRLMNDDDDAAMGGREETKMGGRSEGGASFGRGPGESGRDPMEVSRRPGSRGTSKGRGWRGGGDGGHVSSSYTSRAFKVLYACESFGVEHFVQFEVDLDATRVELDDAAVVVEFELFHCRLDPKANDKPPRRSDLFGSPVATQRATVTVPAGGVHEYFPVHFDELHLTLCNVTLHTALVRNDERGGVSVAASRGADAGGRANGASSSAAKTSLMASFGCGSAIGCGGGTAEGRDVVSPTALPRESHAVADHADRPGADSIRPLIAALLEARSVLSLPEPLIDAPLGQRVCALPPESLADRLAELYAALVAPLAASAELTRAVATRPGVARATNADNLSSSAADGNRTSTPSLSDETDSEESLSALMDRHAEVTMSAARRQATAFEWAADAVRRAEEGLIGGGERPTHRSAASAEGVVAATCAATLEGAWRVARDSAEVAWQTLRDAVRSGGPGGREGTGAWLLAPLRDRWETKRDEEWAPWVMRARAAAIADELAVLGGAAGGDRDVVPRPGSPPGSATSDVGSRRGPESPWSTSSVTSEVSSQLSEIPASPLEDPSTPTSSSFRGVSFSADATHANDAGLPAVVGLKGAQEEIARRRRAMEAARVGRSTWTVGNRHGGAPGQRVYDSALAARPEEAPQVSMEEMIPPPPESGARPLRFAREDEEDGTGGEPGESIGRPRWSGGAMTPATEKDVEKEVAVGVGSSGAYGGLRVRTRSAQKRSRPARKGLRTPRDASASAASARPVSRPPGEHLVVFVHGFAGSLQDLRLVRAHMRLTVPNTHTHVSSANHERTMDSLSEMGARLAEETRQAMTDLESGAMTPRGGGRTPRSAAAAAAEAAARGAAPPRLSFVGHSIGNLIIRSALTHPTMEPYLGRLHTFLSISGPHLGYLYSQSSLSLFETGLRVLRALKPSARCLREITFSDARKTEDCYLHRLAHAPQGLALFRHVILVSSPQDKYVPRHSARLQLAGMTFKKGSRRGASLRRMTNALLGPVLKKAAAAEAAEAAAEEAAEAAPEETGCSDLGEEETGSGVEGERAQSSLASKQSGVEMADGGGAGAEERALAARAVELRNAVTSLLRADVHFAPPATRSINAMIGRKAHIDLLETDAYIKFLIWKQRDKFV